MSQLDVLGSSNCCTCTLLVIVLRVILVAEELKDHMMVVMPFNGLSEMENKNYAYRFPTNNFCSKLILQVTFFSSWESV